MSVISVDWRIVSFTGQRPEKSRFDPEVAEEFAQQWRFKKGTKS